jgi:uncharacterized SAM-binding protein YcdF (DUF218 family)
MLRVFLLLLLCAFFGWIICLGLFLNLLPEQVDVENVPPADAIIVLTGGEQRIPFGLQLLDAGKGQRLFISGVHNKVDDDTVFRSKTSEIYAQYQRMRDRVKLGRQATTTKENAVEIAAWLKDKPELERLIIVTDHFHMPRSMIELNNRVKGRELFPAPVLPPEFMRPDWWSDSYPLTKIMQEFHKFSVVLVTQYFADYL